MNDLVLVGAGIIGLSTALWCQKNGLKVILVDREEPGSGTSYGNAGILSAASIIPVTTPGLLRKIPKMLLNPNEPLFMRFSYLPKVTPFLFKYLNHAKFDHVRIYADAMSTLLYDSVEQHRALAAGTDAEHFISDRDYLIGYNTNDAFQADAIAWKIREEKGYTFKVLTGSELSKVDPVYKNKFQVIVANKKHGMISDPGAYLRALYQQFIRKGGFFEKSIFKDVVKNGNKITGIKTSNKTLHGKNVAFTLGPWSGEVAQKLELNIPFESERGYHIELINPSHMPTQALKVDSGKFIVTPMLGRIRLAGISEFGGLSLGPSKAPIDLLKKHVKTLFPKMKYDRVDEWLGHRPTTANSLPVIGKLNKFENVFVGFGHQHVGLTGGAKTGRILAGLISANLVDIDLSHFDPNIYKKN